MNSEHHYLGVVAGPDRLLEEQRCKLWEVLDLIARSRAALNAEAIVGMLDEDSVYESQGVLEPIVGKHEVAEYLHARFAFFDSVKDKQDIGHFRRGVVDLPIGKNFPCLIFFSGEERLAVWTVRLNEQGKIDRIDILTVAPPPRAATLVPDHPGY